MTLPEKVVYVAGVARSGTSWIGQIVNSSPDVRFRFQPFFSYEFKGRVDEESDRPAFESLFAELYRTESGFLTQADKRRSGEYPEFAKRAAPSALAFKENRYQSIIEPMLRRIPYLQVVGVVRHPCAVLNSWRQNAKEFPPGSEILKEWRFGGCKNGGHADYFGYYKWKEVANLYLDLKEKYPDRFALVRYEDLVGAPMQGVEALFAFLDIACEEQTRAFVDESTSRSVDSYYSVYRGDGVSLKWRDELDPYIIDEIQADLTGTRLERFLCPA